MKRVQRLIHKIKEHKVLIPVSINATYLCKRLDSIRKGTVLYTSNNQRIEEAHALNEELGVNIKDISDYLVRIDGEYIMQGEIIAERLINGGLSLKRVIAGKDGILSFSRINKGIVDILGEQEVVEYRSPIYGKIIDIDINEGIYLSTECFSVFGKNNYRQEKVEYSGNFVFLGTGESIYTIKHLDESYEGKIVFVGKYVYPEVITELYKRGASHVITYSINYDDFKNIQFPVTVLGGYGNITMPDMWYRSIKDFNNSYASIVVDKGKSTIYIVDDAQYLIENQIKLKYDIVDNLKVGMDVRIRDVSNLNEIGKIAYIDNDYVQVKLESGSIILVNARSLDLVSY